MTGCAVVRAHLRMTVDVRRLLTVICAGIEPRWQFRIAITLFTRHGPPLSSKFVLDDFRERITE